MRIALEVAAMALFLLTSRWFAEHVATDLRTAWFCGAMGMWSTWTIARALR